MTIHSIMTTTHSHKTTPSKPMVILMMIMGFMTTMGLPSAQAADNNGALVDSNTASEQVDDPSLNQEDKLKQQPDNLAGYIKKEIDQLGTNEVDANDIHVGENTQIDSDSQLQRPSQAIQANSFLEDDYNEAFYKLSQLNAGLPELSPAPNLQTPLATLEFFNSANLQRRYDLAAYALNLNPIPEKEQISLARDLVKKLDYLLTENGLYVFGELPDRADGLVEPPIGSASPIEGVPRRSIKLGEIDFRERKVPIYLERVQVDDRPPIWVFSSQTVENINVLYDIHKPPEFERYLPNFLTSKLFGMSVWEFILLLLFTLITLGIGYGLSKVVEVLVSKYTQKKIEKNENDALSLHSKGLTDLVSKITLPLTITVSFSMVFALVSGGLPGVPVIGSTVRPLIWVVLVVSSLWLGIRIINFFANRYQDFQIDSLSEEEFIKQRQRMTYLSIFRRLFIFSMVLIGAWISLAEFTNLKGLGKTLLTSAGIAGAIIGIAAQTTLGNIIAGFQVAITQPVRIGDTVILDGIWCEVEDLRYTYAVLLTWDDRRMIVPMKYFITEIIENWSHTNVTQSSAVYLYLDYGIDVSAVKRKFIEVVKSHELWVGDVDEEPEVIVTKMTEDSIEIRCKVTAEGPLSAWNLECDVREKMLSYLSKEQQYHLPTERITLTSRDFEK